MPGHNGVGVNAVKSHRAPAGGVHVAAERKGRVSQEDEETLRALSALVFTLPLSYATGHSHTRCVFSLEALHVCRSCFSSPGSLILARTAALPVGV